ncbi:hypothetical protein M404DRAFT_32759 [Pisolithus tinctorius Marx 270]|uniref:Uncharacterized protein n=1 Tax=Pisolithus tinctorius Marx 270 TaxID=870435 RepID=A0A0C3NNN6_PISTI|nr:hypothetical protein M404DRAFT_32759 [Pisolithus tinctorius Marx 270]
MQHLPISTSPPENTFLLMLATPHIKSCSSPTQVFGIILWNGAVPTPEYDIDVQAQIPVALCALHNFIYMHNQNGEGTGDLTAGEDDEGEGAPVHLQAMGHATGVEEDLFMHRMQDNIVMEMWNDYQFVLGERAQRGDMDVESDIESDFFEDEVAVFV